MQRVFLKQELHRIFGYIAAVGAIGAVGCSIVGWVWVSTMDDPSRDTWGLLVLGPLVMSALGAVFALHALAFTSVSRDKLVH